MGDDKRIEKGKGLRVCQAKQGNSKHIAHERGEWIATAVEPDCCRVGIMVIPFDSFAYLDQKIIFSPDVLARGTEVYRETDMFKVVQANAGAGVKSGVSLGAGHVRFLQGNQGVIVNNIPVVEQDRFGLINCSDGGYDGVLAKTITCQVPTETEEKDEEEQEQQELSDEAKELLEKHQKELLGNPENQSVLDRLKQSQEHEKKMLFDPEYKDQVLRKEYDRILDSELPMQHNKLDQYKEQLAQKNGGNLSDIERKNLNDKVKATQQQIKYSQDRLLENRLERNKLFEQMNPGQAYMTGVSGADEQAAVNRDLLRIKRRQEILKKQHPDWFDVAILNATARDASEAEIKLLEAGNKFFDLAGVDKPQQKVFIPAPNKGNTKPSSGSTKNGDSGAPNSSSTKKNSSEKPNAANKGKDTSTPEQKAKEPTNETKPPNSKKEGIVIKKDTPSKSKQKKQEKEERARKEAEEKAEQERLQKHVNKENAAEKKYGAGNKTQEQINSKKQSKKNNKQENKKTEANNRKTGNWNSNPHVYKNGQPTTQGVGYTPKGNFVDYGSKDLASFHEYTHKNAKGLNDFIQRVSREAAYQGNNMPADYTQLQSIGIKAANPFTNSQIDMIKERILNGAKGSLRPQDLIIYNINPGGAR